MARPSASAAHERHVVLVGGGHSHVQVLLRQRSQPLPDARLTVVLDRPVAMYSGMVPGLVAGQYQPAELSIDVAALARSVGAQAVVQACTGINADQRQLCLRDGRTVSYDLCSLNLGSVVAGTDLPGVAEHTLRTRPIVDFTAAIGPALRSLAHRPTPRVVVVGGGAGGVELAFCAQARLRGAGTTPHVALVDAGPRLFASRPPRFSRVIARAAARRGIDLHLLRRVTACTAEGVHLDDGRVLGSDLTLWVAGAAASPVLRDSGLPVDHRGFVRVDDQLRVVGRTGLFAVGDCAVLDSWPSIPKAGVYAVRQGPVLAANLDRSLRGQPLHRYTAQRRFLTLLNLGDGTAIGGRTSVSFAGAWVFRLKDRIDRRFVARFQVDDDAPASPLH